MGFGFLGGHRRHHRQMALDGLGALTRRGSNVATKDTNKVVGGFVRGLRGQGACKGGGSKGPRVCEITSNGLELKVGSFTLAKRVAPNTDSIEVCIPSRATLVTDKNGKTSEAQDSKDVRAAAGSALRVLRAGFGVRTGSDGMRRISTRRGARALVPTGGQCLTIKLTSEMQREAAVMYQAATVADTEAGGAGKATKAKIQAAARKIRKEQAEAKKQKKIAALAAARAAKAAAKAAATAAAAPPAAAAAAAATPAAAPKKPRAKKAAKP